MKCPQVAIAMLAFLMMLLWVASVFAIYFITGSWLWAFVFMFVTRPRANIEFI
jgi:hypothetical protein